MASTLESRLTARLSRYETNPASRALTRVGRHSGDDTVLPGATARRMERSARWSDRVAMRSMGMPSARSEARRNPSFRGGGYRKLVRQFGDTLTNAAYVGELPPWLARVEATVPEEAPSPWYTPHPAVPAPVFWWGRSEIVPGASPVARSRAGALSRSSGIAPPVRRLAPSALPLTALSARRADAAPGPLPTAAALAPTASTLSPDAPAVARSGWRQPTAVRRAAQASAAPLPVSRAAARIGSPLQFSRGTGSAAAPPSVNRAVARFESARPSGRGFAAARSARPAARSFGGGFAAPELALPNLPAAAFGSEAADDGSLGVVDGFSYSGPIDHGRAPVSETPWYTAPRTATAARNAASAAPLARAAARSADTGTSATSTPAARIAARAGLSPAASPVRHGLTRRHAAPAAPLLGAAPALVDGRTPEPAAPAFAASPVGTAARSLTAPAARRSASGSTSALSRMTDRSIGRAGPSAVRQAASGLGRRQALLSTAALAIAAPAPSEVLSAFGVDASGLGGETAGRPLTWNAGTSDAWASSPNTGPAVTIPLELSGTRVASRSATPAARTTAPAAVRTSSAPAARRAAARRSTGRAAPTAVARAIAASTSSAPPVGGALGRATSRATSLDRPTAASASPAARTLARGIATVPMPSARRPATSAARSAAPTARRSAARRVDLALPEVPFAELAGGPEPLEAAGVTSGSDAWGTSSAARAPIARSASPASRALARFDAPAAAAPEPFTPDAAPLARAVQGSPGVRALARFGAPGEELGGQSLARSLSVAGGLGARPAARRPAAMASFDPIVAAPAPASFAPTDEAADGTPGLARTTADGIAESPWGRSPDTGPAVVVDANAPTALRRAASRSPLARAFDRAGVPTATPTSSPAARRAVPGDPVARRPRPLTRASFDAPLPSLPAGIFGAVSEDGTSIGAGFDGSPAARSAATGARSPWASSPNTGAATVVGWTGEPLPGSTPDAPGAPRAARSAGSPTHRTASSASAGARLVRTSSMARALGRDASTVEALPGAPAAAGAPIARRPGFRRSFAGGLELPSFAALPPGVVEVDDAPLGSFGSTAPGAVTASPWYTASTPAAVARAASRASAPGATRVSRQAARSGGSAELPRLPGASPAARAAARRKQGPRGLSRALQRSSDVPVGIAARSPLLAPDLTAPLLPNGTPAEEAATAGPSAGTGWARASRSSSRTTKAARKGNVGTGTLASLKGLRATDGIPEELSAATPAHEARPMADGSAMVARAARRLSSDTRAARRASADLTTATPAARQASTSAEPRVSRSEIGTMVSRRIAEELTTISAPAPGGGISGAELRRQVNEQLAREATPSTQQSGGAAKSKDVEDAFRRAVRRIFKEEQIRSERDLTPFG